MREIKFRAYVTSLSIPFMAVQGEPDLETLQSFIFHYGDEKKLMQFTGLKDKNGKEIYEGDVINSSALYKYTVVWSLGGFYAKGKNFKGQNIYVPLDYEFLENKEVIGNIYQNHELL